MSHNLSPGASYELSLDFVNPEHVDQRVDFRVVNKFAQHELGEYISDRIVFLLIPNVTVEEIATVCSTTAKFCLAPGITKIQQLDCTIPGQALIYFPEFILKNGISIADLKDRARENIQWLTENLVMPTCEKDRETYISTHPSVHDSQIVVDYPELTVISAMRRGFLQMVTTDETTIASAMTQLSLASPSV